MDVTQTAGEEESEVYIQQWTEQARNICRSLGRSRNAYGDNIASVTRSTPGTNRDSPLLTAERRWTPDWLNAGRRSTIGRSSCLYSASFQSFSSWPVIMQMARSLVHAAYMLNCCYHHRPSSVLFALLLNLEGAKFTFVHIAALPGEDCPFPVPKAPTPKLTHL